MIEIEWVETPITVKVDMSALTWNDLKAIRALQGDEAGAEAAVEAVVTRVTGIEAGELPAQVFAAVVEGMMARASGNAAKN